MSKAKSTKALRDAKKKMKPRERSFLARESSLGKTKSSKFFQIVAEAGAKGITRAEIVSKALQRHLIDKRKNPVDTAKQLNWPLDEMQNLNLIRKEAVRGGKFFVKKEKGIGIKKAKELKKILASKGKKKVGVSAAA